MARARSGRPRLRVVRPRHTLIYGLRLLRDEGQEASLDQPHVRLAVPRPDGSTESLTLHTITGEREEIRRRLHESVDAFFDILADEVD